MCGPTRRGFLKALGIGSISLLLPLLTPATGKAGGRKEICKGVSFLPPAYRAVRSGIDGFIEALTSHPANEMEVQFFDSGTLMNADAQLPELKKGSIDFMFQSTTYISQDVPILGITGLPGICDQLHEHGDRLAMESPLWKLINDELAKENLFMLTIGRGLVEPEYLWSTDLKITGLADLKGRTCRVVGHEAARLLEQVGARVVRIPSSQTFLALQRGSVESAVFAVDTVIARNLQNQLRYCFKLPITAVGNGCLFPERPVGEAARRRQGGVLAGRPMVRQPPVPGGIQTDSPGAILADDRKGWHSNCSSFQRGERRIFETMRVGLGMVDRRDRPGNGHEGHSTGQRGNMISGSSRICGKTRLEGNQTILVWLGLAPRGLNIYGFGPELEALVTFTAPRKSAMNMIPKDADR